jgi:hypothetical protein
MLQVTLTQRTAPGKTKTEQGSKGRRHTIMKNNSSTNHGIQARDIQAEAIAVGENARATVTGSRHQSHALDRLIDAIRQLQLNAAWQQTVLDHVESMKTEDKRHHPSTFEKIISAAKEVGHLSELAEPLKAVATAFGLSST